MSKFPNLKFGVSFFEILWSNLNFGVFFVLKLTCWKFFDKI